MATIHNQPSTINRLLTTSAIASVANFTSCLLRNGPKLKRVVPPVTSRSLPWLRPFGHIYTILVVLAGWVMFRSDTWPHAMGFFRSLAGATATGGWEVIPAEAFSPGVLYALLAGLVFSVPVRMVTWRGGEQRGLISRLREFGEVGVALVVLSLCLLVIGAGSPNPFIYYRF